MKVPTVKQKRIAAEDVHFHPFSQMLGLFGVCLRPVVLYPSDGELHDEGMYVRVYVCVCMFIYQIATAQSGPVILVILCRSH